MTAPALLTSMSRRDVRLWVEGNRLAFDAPVGALSDADLELLRERRDELIALLGRPAAPLDWETLSALRWGGDPTPEVVISQPTSEPVACQDEVEPGPPDEPTPRPTSWVADDAPAWVFDDTLTVRSADIRAAAEEQRDADWRLRTKTKP